MVQAKYLSDGRNEVRTEVVGSYDVPRASSVTARPRCSSAPGRT
jgi:hypothetical protein